MNTALILISEVQYSNLPPGFDVSRLSNFPQFVLVFIDISMALWCWTRRKEAWGIAVGIGVIQVTLPFIWNPFMNAVILLITSSQILLLLVPNVRNEFVVKSTLHHREQDRTHHPVFWVIILIQTLKSILVIFGGVLLLQTQVFFEPHGHGSVFWILNIPYIPLALLMGAIGFIAAAGLYRRKEWSYDVTLTLAVLGIIEAQFASSMIIFYISVCIGLLMLSDEAKVSFSKNR